MSAYIVIRIASDNPARLKDYQLATPPIIEKYHGKFIVRGGATETLEGPEETRRLVVLEFPDMAAAKAFYHSPEYSAAKALRQDIATAEFVAVEGYSA